MPIKGITTGNTGRLPIIGQIRKGDTGGKNGAPRELDHFRVIFNEAEQDAAKIFTDVYGPTPTEISVMFPVDEVDRVWDAWLLAFQGKKLIAKSDGERYWYKVDTETGEVVVENGEPYLPYTRDAVEYTYTSRSGAKIDVRCTPRARMYVLVKELFEQGYLSCLEFHTGSWNDIRNISDQIAMMAALSKGRLAYTPLTLSMYPETILRTTSSGHKAEKKTHLVKLEIDPVYARAALARRSETPAQLGAGDDWEPEPDEEPDYTEGDYSEVAEPAPDPEPPIDGLPDNTKAPADWTEFWEWVRADGRITVEKAKECVSASGQNIENAWKMAKNQMMKKR